MNALPQKMFPLPKSSQLKKIKVDPMNNHWKYDIWGRKGTIALLPLPLKIGEPPIKMCLS